MDTVTDLLAAERKEREAIALSRTEADRERHFMAAERLADRAWSMAEEAPDCPHVPSGLWPECEA